jgi:hypothetical protein
MNQARTVEECKRILIKVAIKHGVAPRVISERLLSLEDKDDMLCGLISFDTLDCHVKVWKEYRMCNYADGTGRPYDNFRLYQGVGQGSMEKVAPLRNLGHRN